MLILLFETCPLELVEHLLYRDGQSSNWLNEGRFNQEIKSKTFVNPFSSFETAKFNFLI